MGLSLSDHYWVKPAGSNLSWDEVNFFENGFSPDVGDALLGKLSKTSDIDLRSPDWTCDGNLRKRWAILDGKRCLVKAGSGPFHQQPFNEVIASKMADRLGIPHIPTPCYGMMESLIVYVRISSPQRQNSSPLGG